MLGEAGIAAVERDGAHHTSREAPVHRALVAGVTTVVTAIALDCPEPVTLH